MSFAFEGTDEGESFVSSSSRDKDDLTRLVRRCGRALTNDPADSCRNNEGDSGSECREG